MSIDQFCAERGLAPRVIKIDVEGAELAVLRGARSTIAAAGPGLQLFVEMHPHLWPALGISADDVRRECEAQGLVAERLDGSRGRSVADRRRLPAAASRSAHEDRRRARVGRDRRGSRDIPALGDPGDSAAAVIRSRSCMTGAVRHRSAARARARTSPFGVEERGLDACSTSCAQWRPDVGFSHNMGAARRRSRTPRRAGRSSRCCTDTSARA